MNRDRSFRPLQAERALAKKPDREQAQELVDMLPQLDVDLTLLAEESFREMLAALDFAATFEPARDELKGAGNARSGAPAREGRRRHVAPLSVPSARTGRRGRKLASAFVQVEATYSASE